MAENRGSGESPRPHGSKDKVRGMQSRLGPRPGDKWPSDSLVDTPVGRRHRTNTSQAPAPWRSRGGNPGRRVPAEWMDAPVWRTPDCLKGAGPDIFFFFPLRNAVTYLLICCQMFKQLKSPGALFPWHRRDNSERFSIRDKASLPQGDSLSNLRTTLIR